MENDDDKISPFIQGALAGLLDLFGDAEDDDWNEFFVSLAVPLVYAALSRAGLAVVLSPLQVHDLIRSIFLARKEGASSGRENGVRRSRRRLPRRP